MVILDGNDCGLADACSRIVANPNPEHIREAVAGMGYVRPVADMIGDSIADSALLSYAVRGDAAFICGLGIMGITRFQVWMIATADTVERPRWLWREAKRCIKAIDRHKGKGMIYWQEIPVAYERGLNFVKHLGFKEVRKVTNPFSGTEMVVVEREVPAWDS